MTYEPPQFQQHSHGQPFTPPAQPQKKRWGPGKITLLTVGIIAAVCLGGGALAALAGNSSSPPVSGGKTLSTGAPARNAADEGPATEPAATVTPSVNDFTLTAKVTRKHCFGSAGCNVNYKVDVAYDGPALDPSDTWMITYEATGDDSGPVTNQIEVAGSEYSGEEESVSTPSSGTKIKIRVTDVEKQ